MTAATQSAHRQSLLHLTVAVAVITACGGDAGNAQVRTPAAGASACLPASEISEAVGFEVVLLDRASQVVGPRRICGYQSTDGADQTFVSTIVLPASDGEQAIQDVRAAAKTMSGAEAEAVDLGDGGVAYTSSGRSEAVVSHGDRVYRVDLTTAGLGNRGDKDAALAVVRKLMR